MTVWKMIKVLIFQTWALGMLMWATPREDVRTTLALHELAKAMLADEKARQAALQKRGQ